MQAIIRPLRDLARPREDLAPVELDVLGVQFGCAWLLGVPAIVLGELCAGFALGSRRAENERELGAFLENAVVHVLDVDDAAARIHADIVVALQAAGTPLPTNDIRIAAVCAREGATVLSYDAHFSAIGRVGSQILSRE